MNKCGYCGCENKIRYHGHGIWQCQNCKLIHSVFDR